MHQTPTAHDVADLGVAISRDGFGPHEEAVAELAELAGSTGRLPGAVAVLTDRSAPTVARERAYAVLSRHWNDMEPLVRDRQRFDESFAALLSSWTQHHDRRNTGTLAARWASHTDLSARRLDSAIARRRLVAGQAP